jgi:hypothetical protein
VPSFVTGVVTEVLSERAGLQRVDTDEGRAFVLTGLVGPVAVGDRVVLSTTAVELGLGTGGWHVVHWNLERDGWSEPGPGHILKLRYTSLQADVGAAEEAHPDLPADLGGMPVVACGLHSQMACVVAAIADRAPGTRVAYVMTDGAALPLALSDLVADLVAGGLLTATITAGHAFGGDLEAVSVPSALVLARRVAGADIAVVAMGPGVVGTGTPLGTPAVEVAPVLDAAAALGGRPIACLRASSGDGRDRHRGVSHHSTTALALARSRAAVPVPAGVERDPVLVGLAHDVVVVDGPEAGTLLDRAGLHVTTMGRGPAEDALFFACAVAAGTHAADLAVGQEG